VVPWLVARCADGSSAARLRWWRCQRCSVSAKELALRGHQFVDDERQTVQQLISPVAAGGATPRRR
jgi:hypothetical protein